jgi:hydroxypyruvate isomerase
MNFASIVKTLKAVGYKGYLAGDFLPVPTAEAAAQKNIAYLRDLVKD